ncbi:MAG: hypothetical protein OEM82_03655 [Acidobacteriota bacterium]|nr:hypothetical protein [Acidobacteriota bacterium]MDH3528683.1 hypothetical protein [Acidobacteriota bacterium]
MRVIQIAAVVLLAAFGFGCAPVKGEPVDYARACDRGNDKKTIEVKGFLDDAGGLFCSDTSGRMECGFKLKDDLEASSAASRRTSPPEAAQTQWTR